MNTLDDLRSTLRDHAADPEQAGMLDTPARTASLRGRVRATRRRRMGGAGVVTAAVFAAVALAPALLPGDRSPGPANVPAELAGHPVPETIEAAGWTYEYAGSVTGTDQVELDLAAADEPRLLAWANEVTPPPGQLEAWKVAEPEGYVYQPAAADFSQYWQAPEDLVGTFTFYGPGENALAVYELSDEPPAGVTVEGVTFRDRVAGDRLIAADAVRGASTLSMRLTVPTGMLRFGAFCAGRDGQVELELSLDGEVVSSGGGCGPRAPFDPGAHWTASFPEGLETDAGPVAPGDVVDVEVRLLDADGEPLDVGDDVALGASFYEMAEAAAEVAGQEVPRLVEHLGVTWELDRTETFGQGSRAGRGRPVDEPSLAHVFVSRIPQGATARIRVGDDEGSNIGGAGSGNIGGIPVPTGSRVEVRMDGAGAGSRHTWGAAIYTRAD
ncbi:hypothetical protein [Nocardioides campestrisoli]|uniref:hypothetical protein n=1 Tax=Nocardioides campestrisoli TaxID=2736757 RepID=UPI0015E75B2C|nr:hypothetical protein [Nocardioides campestrisoli]